MTKKRKTKTARLATELREGRRPAQLRHTRLFGIRAFRGGNREQIAALLLARFAPAARPPLKDVSDTTTTTKETVDDDAE